jgi:hypothetical protein
MSKPKFITYYFIDDDGNIDVQEAFYGAYKCDGWTATTKKQAIKLALRSIKRKTAELMEREKEHYEELAKLEGKE